MNTLYLHMKDMNMDFSRFRFCSPSRLAHMERSLSLSGQLQPVIVRPKEKGYQLLDGFKRFYAALSLGWEGLDCRVVEVDDCHAKAMIFTCNAQSGGLMDYEQAIIMHSLCREHLLDQKAIASLIGKSISWVSRRLAFIERLDDSAATELKLGRITSTHARELTLLPRGKQETFLKMVIGENLTSRQTGLLVKKYLVARTSAEQDFILSHPRQVLEQAMAESELQDSRLGVHGNRLLRSSRLLMHHQHIFIGQSTNPPLEELSLVEWEVLFPVFTGIATNARHIQNLLNPKRYER